ncbi:GspH/FimT family protein [Synechococcus sp. KORDI-52]|uniref:GspH/FimT family pseudopilin n=1 Tax=Synechococcus sp. KORDI-52 TaxID=585425 RepID=UPI0012EBAA35|nr:GspH/FimT family protein [Synechococcus sp. KORDI-52]
MTLIEALIGITIIGGMVTLVMPSFLFYVVNNELNSSTKLTVGWLEELRKEAQQKSVICRASWNFTEATIQGSCGDDDQTKLLDINFTTSREIAINNHSGPTTWIFTPQGTSTTSGQVVFTSNDSPEETGRCIKLTAPLAVIGAGKRSSSGICDFTKIF